MENSFNGNEELPTFQPKSTLMKGFLVFVLTIIMLIPVPIILNLIEERKEHQENVLSEISKKWSSPQVIYGPFIQIEYLENSKDEKGNSITNKQFAYVSANENNVNSAVENSIKKRSLYEAVVYHSKNTIQSKFPSYQQMLTELELKQENITAVKYIFAVQDIKGFDNKVEMKSGDKSFPLNVEESSNLSVNETIVIKEEYLPETSAKYLNLELLGRTIDPKIFDFNSTSIQFNLKGSNSIRFIPSALQTNVTLTTNWNDLKFDGYVLPSDEVVKTADQSTVSWKVHQQKPLNGQFWKGNVDFENYTFGVDFIQMNDNYDKTYRSTKYAILFIGLTFVAFFFIENKNKFNIHIVQYALVGFAICINFVLLLSISEYLGFDYAFIISACATLLMITLFVQSFIQSWRLTLKISIMLFFIYAFIYSVLQLKEHALLVGSIGLFIILAIIMYYSKSIEWDRK